MKLRSYEGMHDFYAMLDLLSEGYRAHNGTHYVHRGDLQWWLFYTENFVEGHAHEQVLAVDQVDGGRRALGRRFELP